MKPTGQPNRQRERILIIGITLIAGTLAASGVHTMTAIEQCRLHMDNGDAQGALQASLTQTTASAQLLLCRASAQLRLGKTQAAEQNLETALSLTSASDHATLAVEILLKQGDLYLLKDEQASAFRTLKQAYELARKGSDEQLVDRVLNSLATAYYNSGRVDLAKSYYHQLVDRARSQGKQADLSVALFNLGHAHASLKAFTEAEQCFSQAFSLSERLDDDLGGAFALKAWAETDIAQGNLVSASKRLKQALTTFEEARESKQVAAVHRHLGDLAMRQKDYPSAVNHYVTAIPILEQHHFQNALMRSYRGLAEALAAANRHPQAYAVYQVYTQLLKEHLEQKNQQSTQRLQAEFETTLLSHENDRLAEINKAQQQALNHERERKIMLLGIIGLSVTIALLLLALWRHGRNHARKMELLATRDELTGLHNRRSILASGEAKRLRCQRENTAFCCMIFDIDHFKAVNDTWGHDVGDIVLRVVAQTVKEQMRRTDTVGRYGGEEFLIISPGSNINDACVLAERIRATVAAADQPEMNGQQVTVSIGIAEMQQNSSLQELIKQADQALYEAKDSGRNRVCCHATQADIEERSSVTAQYLLMPQDHRPIRIETGS